MSQGITLSLGVVLTMLSYLIAIIISMSILLENRDPSKTLSWMMMFILLPGVGIIIYILSGRNIRKHKIFKAKEKTKKLNEKMLFENLEALKRIVKNQQEMLKSGE